MVISDLQYLESVEASNLVGSGKAYGKKYRKPYKPYKKGGFGNVDIDVNVAIVTIEQTAINLGKGDIKQYASVNIDQ